MRYIALSLVALGALVGVAAAAQENMQDALQDLRQARESLQKASENKEGHRARALDYVDKAIDEVQQGMTAARDEQR